MKRNGIISAKPTWRGLLFLMCVFCFVFSSCNKEEYMQSYYYTYRYFTKIILCNISDTPFAFETNFPISGILNNPCASGILNKDESCVLYDAELYSFPHTYQNSSIGWLSFYPRFYEGKVKIYDYDPEGENGKGVLRVNCDLLDLTYITAHEHYQERISKCVYTEIRFLWNNPIKYICDEEE